MYFPAIDHAAQTAGVMRYGIAEGTAELLYGVDYTGETSIMNLSRSENQLAVTGHIDGRLQLVLWNLDTAEERQTPLPESVYYVYDAAYDASNGSWALYYGDTAGNEHIGLMPYGLEKIYNIFTFSPNVYAYQDRIDCKDGHLYWIIQVNGSGRVTDHYCLVDYDYEWNRPTEHGRTFHYSLGEGELIALSFDRDADYENIVLTAHPR